MIITLDIPQRGGAATYHRGVTHMQTHTHIISPLLTAADSRPWAHCTHDSHFLFVTHPYVPAADGMSHLGRAAPHLGVVEYYANDARISVYERRVTLASGVQTGCVPCFRFII